MFLRNCRVFDFPSLFDFDDTQIKKLKFNLEEKDNLYILTLTRVNNLWFWNKNFKNILYVKVKKNLIQIFLFWSYGRML